MKSIPVPKMLRTADIQDMDFGWVSLRGICARLCFPDSSVGKESTCNMGDLGLIPGLGRSPGKGNGNLFQYSCLENSMDRGAGALPPAATPDPAALAERGLPRIPFAAQARAAPDVSVFGARRLPTPAAQGPLNLLRA